MMSPATTDQRLQPLADSPAARTRVVTYERVSSEDQRERATIKTQTEDLARRLADDPTVELIDRYVDDGVSGMTPMAKRPGGARLLADARASRFDQIWVFKLDRLGRDDVDPLMVRRELDALGIKLVSLHDNVEGTLEFALRVAIAAEERRAFLTRSAAGMNRAARDGRYCGGIVAFGYEVEGHKAKARLVPSERPVWGDRSTADLVRQMYHWLGVEGWSCRRVADELNALGVPTAYELKGPGRRGKRTQGLWRSGRIRNLLVNPDYKGEQLYGRRSGRDREVIIAAMPALVSADLWEAAQQTLRRNRIIPKGTIYPYLLRGVIQCGLCGLHFCGTRSNEVSYYRCDGQMVERGPQPGRCPSKSIKGLGLEEQVWSDIERFLCEPGALLDELAEEASDSGRQVVLEAELLTLRGVLGDLAAQQERVERLAVRGLVSEPVLLDEVTRIKQHRTEVQRRLAVLTPVTVDTNQSAPHDLLADVRQRLDAGLTITARQEIVRLLVARITIHTEVDDRGKKHARAVVEYRFPTVGSSDTVRGSSPPGAGSWREK